VTAILEVWQDSLTGGRGGWVAAARQPTRAEVAIAASAPGGQFFISPDGPQPASTRWGPPGWAIARVRRLLARNVADDPRTSDIGSALTG
jgi:hypothetical protein